MIPLILPSIRLSRNTSRRVASALPACLRWRSCERWVHRHLGTVEHEHKVTRIATRLFDLTRDLHGLDRGALRLLQTAAVVHDVGRSVCDATHHIDGSEMLLEETGLPFTFVERRQLAYLTRFHRGSVPDAGKDGILGRGDDADRLIRVLALLRAADALDSRKIASPRLFLAMKGQSRLQVTCYVDSDFGKAKKVYARRKKFRLMEDSFGCEVQVSIAHADQLALVA